jgi:iron complex transport system ATP-binding protein
MTALALNGVAVAYGARRAVAPSSLELASGTLVGLIGPNGAGKSSLLKAIAGLVPSSGTVCWGERTLTTLEPRSRARALAYLPQDPAAHWPMSVRDLVALGRLPHRAFGTKLGAADLEAVEWAMAETGVLAFAARSAAELSAGERARVLVARALAVRAPVLIADEPVTSLDPYYQLEIMAALARYAAAGQLVVAVLHDLALAARFCERIVLMHDGAIVADDRPEQVLDAATLARYYRIEAYLARHERQPVIVPWRRLD